MELEYPERRIDVEVYKDGEWAQGRFCVHGVDDGFWTDSPEDAVAFVLEALHRAAAIVDTGQAPIATMIDLSEVSYANAHLIAAAPALLEALNWINENRCGDNKRVIDYPLREVVRAAIALATPGEDGTP